MKNTTTYLYKFSILILLVVSFVVYNDDFIDFDIKTVSLDIDIDHCNDTNEDNKDSGTEDKVEEFTLERSSNAFLFFHYTKHSERFFITKDKNYNDLYIDFSTPPPEIKS